MRLDVYVCTYVCVCVCVCVCDIDCVGGPMRRRHGDALAERMALSVSTKCGDGLCYRQGRVTHGL